MGYRTKQYHLDNISLNQVKMKFQELKETSLMIPPVEVASITPINVIFTAIYMMGCPYISEIYKSNTGADDFTTRFLNRIAKMVHQFLKKHLLISIYENRSRLFAGDRTLREAFAIGSLSWLCTSKRLSSFVKNVFIFFDFYCIFYNLPLFIS